MEKPRPCGCKGIRTCLICENEYGIRKKDFSITEGENTYVYCPWCNKAWPGWDMNMYRQHPNHEGEPLDFPGIYIQLDFLSIEEENCLMKGIDEMPWDLSQSGRRKQNFGPKCNFKKQRLKMGDFQGFPSFSKFVQEKFEDVGILQGYRTIEQCTLEYDPSRGASIDPHIDDCWIWGERIVTVNLVADCTLSMTPYLGDLRRYNLRCVSTYPPVVAGSGDVVVGEHKQNAAHVGDDAGPIVRVPMPRRSLLVLYGPARYNWEHCVLRQDVAERRVCLAYREFTPPYTQAGEHENVGSEILNQAENFWDHLSAQSVGSKKEYIKTD